MVQNFVMLLRTGARFKSDELFISGIFRLIFLDLRWQWVTETWEGKTMDKGGRLYISQMTSGLKTYMQLIFSPKIPQIPKSVPR